MNKLYKNQIVVNNKLQEKLVMTEMFKLKMHRQTFKFKIFYVQKSGKNKDYKSKRKKYSLFKYKITL